MKIQAEIRGFGNGPNAGRPKRCRDRAIAALRFTDDRAARHMPERPSGTGDAR
ncbi:MAG: hypothetical protein HLUCCA08_16820 [Rhodobacteraceae bacterium HLUCCA08]|nr:MAG: hypothetical protein HLUCCA08_16820 [Rhodobacteraceae bacterium HLUCCA08]